MDLKKNNDKLSLFVLIAVMVLILITGILVARWRSSDVDSKIKEDILLHTVEIARTINPDLIKRLTFTEADAQRPEYLRIRSQMMAYGRLIRQRGIYSMALRDSNIVFGPENYAEGDPMGSGPPGTIYEEPTAMDYEIFKTGKPIVMGPEKDEYGTFISGLAPIIDPATGKVLLVIGIDILSADWEMAITSAYKMPLLGTILVILLLGAGYILIHRRSKLPEPERNRLLHIETYLACLTGILVTLAAIYLSRESETREQHYLFRLKSNAHIAAVRGEFFRIQQEMNMLGIFFENSLNVDYDEFRNFSGASNLYKSSVNFFWAPKINRQNKKAFEQSASAVFHRNITISQSGPDLNNLPTVDHAYYPIFFADSSGNTMLTAGFVLNSIPNVGQSIQDALTNRMITGVESDSLIQRYLPTPAILAIKPVFKRNLNGGVIQKQIPIGLDSSFVGVSIVLSSILESALTANMETGPQLAIDLVDLTNQQNPRRIASIGDDQKHLSVTFNLEDYNTYKAYYMAPLFIFGRSYAVITHSTRLYQTGYPTGKWWLVGFAGLIITLIITFFIRFIQNRQVNLTTMVMQRTAELEKAKNQAMESDRLKSAFLANMSHEIRTPMNAIVGFSAMLNDPDLTAEDRNRYVDIINSRSDDLLHLVNDILEISRIESGTIQIVKVRLNLNTLLDDLLIEFRQKIHKVGKTTVSLVAEKPLSLAEAVIITDGYIIKQIFTNLIDNAIKFTRSGEICFGYLPPENQMLTCFVKDSGIGISTDDQKVIFENFRQADFDGQHLYGGTGLGLAICKGSLEILGGSIRIESSPGNGSTFFFTFPFDNLEPFTAKQGEMISSPKSVKQNNWEGKKILLVEDEPTNMEFLCTILAKTRAELVCAASGQEARNYYDSLDSYSLVLLDVRLPDVNGWDLCKEIKSKHPDLPVIAQTAFAMATDQIKGNEAGFDDYITKPIDRKKLLQMIAGFFNK